MGMLFYDLQTQLASGMAQSTAIAMGIASVILFLVTLNIPVSLMAIAVIIGELDCILLL